MALPMPIKRNDEVSVPETSRLSPGEIMERVMVKGDLKALTPGERAGYYSRVCESIGVNPLTKPFAYIELNGKLVLYALRDCTDQLRKIHNVSVIESTQEELQGIYVVVCKVKDATGRTDIARGAVNLAKLQGEALANAIMKCETKAKRRATLSICGLGILDETEIEDITPKRKSSASAKRDGTTETFNDIRKQIQSAPDLEFLKQLPELYATELPLMPPRWALLLSHEYEDKWSDFGGEASEIHPLFGTTEEQVE